MKPAKIAVIGASGYTGLELLRLLLTHPYAELVCVTSRQNAGQRIADLFPRFSGASAADLTFIDPDPDAVAASGAEVAFLALPHGVAAGYASSLLEKGLKIVDLSADFRLDDKEVYKEFYDADHPAPELLAEAVYGLPEVHRDAIIRCSAGGLPRLLSHKHQPTTHPPATGKTHRSNKHRHLFDVRGQWSWA